MAEDLQSPVPDPTDFPPEADAPGLRQLDSAFRCGICGEIYDAPMMLQHCGHSFCSVCARQSLRERHECPQCRKPAEEMHLVKNAQLEELSITWRLARAFTLQLIERVDKLAKATLDASERPRKKRKLDSPPTPRTRRRDTNASAVHSGPSKTVYVEDVDDSEEMLRRECVPSSDAEENECQIELEQQVPCPICARDILVKHANAHIESGCTSFLIRANAHRTTRKRTDTKNAWDSMFNGSSMSTSKPGSRAKWKGKESRQRSPSELIDDSVERLAKPSYSVLRDKKIRDMLFEQGLPTTGSKEQLIARHSHYVLLFNANLDRISSQRRSVPELRRELRKWEEGIYVKKSTVNDARTYLKANSSDFKKHIEAVRANSGRVEKKESRSSELGHIPRDASAPESLSPGASKDADQSVLENLEPPESPIVEEVLVVADSESEDELST
ncbi:hypothetical protein DFH11DRAFT_1724600 [Phellopilus nigrolimitatus]|nr:hypothetical protein DFH11DRAFT_1724600 [Phellopilus nigrolimitatus]